ncbi:hypothetical protein BHM03_00047139, partial [Ensete ventricosum]
SDNVVGARQEFAEGIGKLARKMPRNHRKKTVRLAGRLLEVAGLPGVRSIVELDGLVRL